MTHPPLALRPISCRLLAAAFVLCLATLTARAVHATGFITTNTTMDNAGFNDDWVIGYADSIDLNLMRNPTSPTVEIKAGAVVHSANAFNMSHIIMTGGQVVSSLVAQNSSTIDFSGGKVQSFGGGGGTINMDGGEVLSSAAGAGTLKFVGTGGIIHGPIRTFEQAQISLTDMLAGADSAVGNGVDARGSSAITLTNTVIGGNIKIQEQSTLVGTGQGAPTGGIIANGKSVDLTDFEVHANLEVNSGTAKAKNVTVGFDTAVDNAMLDMTGGQISGRLVAFRAAQAALMNVDKVGGVQARDLSQVFITGGHILSGPSASDNAGLTLTNVDVKGNAAANGDDACALTLDGGFVDGGVFADVKSTAFLLNGVTVTGLVSATGHGKAEIHDADLRGNVSALDNATVEMSGGSIAGHLSGGDNSTILMTHGSVSGDVFSSQNAKLDITDGIVFGQLSIAGRGLFEPGATTGQAVTVSGGEIQGGVDLDGTRTFRMQNGTVADVRIHGTDGVDRATAIFDGGQVAGDVTSTAFGIVSAAGSHIGGKLDLSGHSLAHMSGGQIEDGIEATDRGTLVSIEAGEIGAPIVANIGAEIEVKGGHIAGAAHAANGAHLEIAGGVFDAGLTTQHDGTTATISNGQFALDLNVGKGTVVTMTGGSFAGTKDIVDGGKLIWSGGTIGGKGPPPAPSLRDLAEGLVPRVAEAAMLPPITVTGGGQLNIVGTDLVATLVDANFEDMFSEYELAGRLADGTSVGGFTFLVKNGSGSTFQLLPIPEPSGAVLLAIAAGLAAFRIWRRT